MFVHNFDSDYQGIIDLRKFWKGAESTTSNRIRIRDYKVEQLSYSADKKVAVSDCYEASANQINILLPVSKINNSGWTINSFRLQATPATIWRYPRHNDRSLGPIFSSNSAHWRIFSVGFPSQGQIWLLPNFDIFDLDGNLRLKIFPKNGNYSQVFCKPKDLQSVIWTVTSYSL